MQSPPSTLSTTTIFEEMFEAYSEFTPDAAIFDEFFADEMGRFRDQKAEERTYANRAKVQGKRSTEHASFDEVDKNLMDVFEVEVDSPPPAKKRVPAKGMGLFSSKF
jgi:hypothetical protein